MTYLRKTRRILPILLIVALLGCACAAPAEQAAAPSITATPEIVVETPAEPDETTAEPAAETTADPQTNLVAMLPVFDSILRAMNGTGAARYAPDDPEFVWTVLYLLSVNWGDTQSQITIGNGTAAVGRAVMTAFLSAAFCGATDLPAVPDDLGRTIAYNETDCAYSIALSDAGDSETKLGESSFSDDGTVSTTAGLYGADGAEILSVRFTLGENPNLQDIPEPLSRYCVTAAEPVEGSSAVWRELDASQPILADLDGDGEAETVSILVDDERHTTTVTITDGSAVLTNEIEVALCGPTCHLGDALTGDGSVELYLSGDMASDDYATEIYRLSDGRLERTELYGTVESADGSGLVTVNTVVNVLGTYGATCQYRMEDDFTFAPATPYTISRYDGDWADRKLTLIRDGFPALPADQSDSEPVALPAGTRLMLTETDEQSYAILERADGALFRVEVSRAQDDWRWSIDGVFEEDWFDNLSYAG